MTCRYCKCGNEMSVIVKEYAWYWCGKCGRFLNGDQLLDPGDEWLEPISSDAMLCELIKIIDELYTNKVPLPDDLDYRSSYLYGYKDALNDLKERILSISPLLQEVFEMKYNEKVSDYNSENQKSNAFQRIGNLVFNKGGNRDDQLAWLGLKEYIKRLEEKVDE